MPLVFDPLKQTNKNEQTLQTTDYCPDTNCGW